MCVFGLDAERTVEYSNKGDIVGIKGRVQSRIIENDGIRKSILEIVSDKITFISNRKEKDVENVEKDIEI